MESDKIEIVKSERELKQLEFVRMISLKALICAWNLYEYAKQNSGPLKSTVGTVENTVTAVVGPVYEKFKGVPGDCLVFLDEKVDKAAKKFDEHAPSTAKLAVSKAQSIVQKASQEAQALVEEAQVAGTYAAIHHAATLWMQLILSVLVRFWCFADQNKLCHAVAEKALPPITLCVEKYNKTVTDLSSKGYAIFSYVPLVPIDEIAKAYKQAEAENGTRTE